MFKYQPENCQPASERIAVCNDKDRGSIELPNHQGYYLFFDFSHPTTCAHRYIARFLEMRLLNMPFNPKEKLCN